MAVGRTRIGKNLLKKRTCGLSGISTTPEAFIGVTQSWTAYLLVWGGGGSTKLMVLKISFAEKSLWCITASGASSCRQLLQKHLLA
jgi:hypothetical protein